MTDTTRRGFFKRLGLAGAATAALPLIPKKETAAREVEDFEVYPVGEARASAICSTVPSVIGVKKLRID